MNALRLVGAIMLLAGSATAQSTGSAETLFRDGRRLVSEGKVSEACAAFEGSERLEHNTATLMNLADCRERQGRLATAWALFLEVEAQTRTPAQADLNAAAKRRALLVEPRLSYLTITVHDHAAGLSITRDGKVVDVAEWGLPIPVDAGPHSVAASAPGRVPWSKSVEISTETRQTIDLPALEAQPPAEPPKRLASVPTLAPTLSPRRKVSIGVAGGALAIATTSVVLGVSSSGLRSEALARCPPNNCSAGDAAAAQSLEDRARGRALAADLGFGLAGAAAIGAVALWIWGAPASSAPIEVAPTTQGLVIGGRF